MIALIRILTERLKRAFAPKPAPEPREVAPTLTEAFSFARIPIIAVSERQIDEFMRFFRLSRRNVIRITSLRDLRSIDRRAILLILPGPIQTRQEYDAWEYWDHCRGRTYHVKEREMMSPWRP